MLLSGTSRTSASESGPPSPPTIAWRRLGDAGAAGKRASGVRAQRRARRRRWPRSRRWRRRRPSAGDFVRSRRAPRQCDAAREWRVRNKLDGVEYAVKRSRSTRGKTLQTAKRGQHAGRMHHEHIVRYYQAWTAARSTTKPLLRRRAARSAQQQRAAAVRAPVPTATALALKHGASAARCGGNIKRSDSSAMPALRAPQTRMPLCVYGRADLQFGGAFKPLRESTPGGGQMMIDLATLSTFSFERSDGDDDGRAPGEA